MKTIKGPAIFLAQFAADVAPFNSLDAIGRWVAGLEYEGVQIPSWGARLFDLKRAADNQDYCDGVKGKLAGHGLSITELSTPPMMHNSTPSPPARCAATRPRDRPGR